MSTSQESCPGVGSFLYIRSPRQNPFPLVEMAYRNPSNMNGSGERGTVPEADRTEAGTRNQGANNELLGNGMNDRSYMEHDLLNQTF